MNEFNFTCNNAMRLGIENEKAQKIKQENEAKYSKQMKLNEKQAEELEKQTNEIKEQTSIIAGLKEITEQNIISSQEYNEASKRTAKWSLLLSIIAIVISIGFGLINDMSSSDWQKNQIKELQFQNAKLETHNKLLQKLNENLKTSK